MPDDAFNALLAACDALGADRDEYRTRWKTAVDLASRLVAERAQAAPVLAAVEALAEVEWYTDAWAQRIGELLAIFAAWRAAREG